MPKREVLRFATADAVAVGVADAAVQRILALQQTLERIDIAITGGTVGIKALAFWASHAQRDEIDYGKLNFWWGDERFVARDSADRNFNQAWDALLQHLDVPAANLHQFPAADEGLDLEAAALEFAAHWESEKPTISFAFMGMGPDGHIASLFPGKTYAGSSAIIAESDSPKPPPLRLSFSFDTINSWREIWFTIAGADKAEPTAVAFSSQPNALPVGRIHGTDADIWFIDEAAASGL